MLGYIIKRYCICVDRSDPSSRKKSLIAMMRELKKGYSLGVFPEGTRNRTTDPVAQFQSGAFQLAIKTKTPILVATHARVKRINPRGFQLLPGKMYTIYSPIIETKDLTNDDVDTLMQQCSQIMIDNLERYS